MEMTMHNGWGKMLYYTELAKIQQRKVKAEKSERTIIKVEISNKQILQDLQEAYNSLGGYPKLLAKLFTDMHKFSFLETSSVTDREENWNKNTFGTIKLYNHSVRSLNIAVIKLEESNIPESQKDFFGLIVLLHDFGKSHALCQHYGIDLSLPHDKRSAYYFKKITQEDDYKIDEHTVNSIFNVLSKHHTASLAEIENDTALKFLIESDKQERK